MISDDYFQNAILHRPNSKTSKPFLVPSNDSYKTSRISEASISSRKSLRVLRPETIKRAITDACMAASIGDLEWLKQSFKITNEQAFDKDGFSTIHLASIHGRLNILQYLIEEQFYDPNFPSAVHCWYPIHLCISNQTGPRSVECLKYLIEKGANINVKNADDIYPLHMAASEGQVECLKLLLEKKPDPNLKDIRGKKPLDLAKLWGHRVCAKLLESYMWNIEKKAEAEQMRLENKHRTQEILKEIEQAHFSYYTEKEESQKNFDQWLINMGFNKQEEPPKSEKKQLDNMGLPCLLLVSDEEFKNSQKKIEKESLPKKAVIPLRKYKDSKVNHSKEWNYSTKSKEKDYVPNLNDFYPRDPYTQLPTNLDLALIAKELKGMSLEQVKEFMKKNLKGEKNNSKLSERPVYYKPKNIIDAQSKIRLDEDEKFVDEAGLTLTNDPTTFPFEQAKNFVLNQNKSKKLHQSLSDNFTQIDKQLTYKDDKLEIVKRNYGSDLSNYMMDKRHGNMSQKYEKVFII